MWMKTGIINKPAYIVCKTPAEKDFLQYPEIKKLSDIKWSPQISIEEGVQITKKSLQERFSQA
jgi:hypothetical protein